MKIKSFIVFAVTLPVLFLINRCEDEKAVPRDYPRLNTFPVTNISDSGALVTGEIYAQGTQQILEYGFLWGKSELLLYGTNDMVILGAPQSTGSFTAFISSTLVKGTTYWVRPFARTTECIVYGNAISFTSLGSLAPLISGFYPDSAGWGDTITIRGKRLSWVPNKNVVKLNGITCYATRSTDTSVIVYVPNSLNIRESLLTVGIEGNTSTYNAKKFRLIMPELSDYNPKQARWGDTVLIKGKRLGTVNYSGNSVKFGTTNCSFIRVRDDSVWIKVPSEISTINNVLNLSINGITLTSGQSFQLLEPYFAFTPAEGTWGSRITLSGRFNAISSRNSFYINNSQAAVVSSNETKAEIIVPADLSSSASQIKYKATPFEINSVNKFVLLSSIVNFIFTFFRLVQSAYHN
ncbi:MAG TPA: IPT/TIG domain-containing protein [Bacteroidales bacterium]|nr:IPT/TIG domain-containing protein [Bacteroidales bacterium]